MALVNYDPGVYEGAVRIEILRSQSGGGEQKNPETEKCREAVSDQRQSQ